MAIELLDLYYHLQCFVCIICKKALGDGSKDVEVRVRKKMLFCSSCHQACLSNDTKSKTNMQSFSKIYTQSSPNKDIYTSSRSNTQIPLQRKEKKVNNEHPIRIGIGMF